MKERPVPDLSAVRARLAADIASGKTVSLSAEELAHPEVREKLPQLLEELTRGNTTGAPPAVRIPGITLLGEIGHGGMSTVYLARQDALDRHVALKIAPRWLASVKKMQSRLMQEARAMARLSHPNIVMIHDILEIDDTVAIAMDWIDGLTLTALLAELPAQPADDDMRAIERVLGWPADAPPLAASAIEFFVRAIRDIARAVHHVHGAGLLHLDIKPSNILVRRNGTPMLADFGVVREIDLAATHTRTFAGTPVYAAPEQLQRDDAHFGPHTDVYGLGMTLYEMLARAQPLRDLDLARVLGTVLGGRLPPLAKRAAIADDLANIVHKAIAPEPEHRYATAQALADDLTAFLEHRPVSARPLSRTQRLRRWARNEPWKASLAGALLVLVPALLVLGTYLLLQLPRIEQQRLAERRAQANDLKQAAYQTYFGAPAPVDEPTHLLAQAMDLEPGATSLACLLSMALEENLPDVQRLLADERTTVEQHLGLRLLTAKAATNRSFFVADEVAQLRASNDHVDKYVLALDRLFRAEDTQVEEDYADAEAALNEATLVAGPDPLLFGLRLWAAERSARPEEFASLVRASRARWDDDPHVLAWLYLSASPVDANAGRRYATELCARHPQSRDNWELLAGDAYRAGEFDTAVHYVDTAGLTSPRLTMYRLLALAKRDGKPAAERALREISPELMSPMRHLRLQRLVDPEAADAERHALLRATPPAIIVLKALYRDAIDRGDRGDGERAWQIARERYPDRVTMHDVRIESLYPEYRRNCGEIARLLEQMTRPRRELSQAWRVACITLATEHSWPTLARYAARWSDYGAATDRTEANAYLGIAEARLGRFDAIEQHFAVALAVHGEKAQWYANALLEDAWLRVGPDQPERCRDPELAALRLQRIEEFVDSGSRFNDGKWAHLVRAEVMFARGDAKGAAKCLAEGSRIAPAEPQAPADIDDKYRDAMRRYRGK
jgi:serine/threonine protein kinase